jgi:hypothetical protein
MKLTSTLITAVLAAHTTRALPTGGNNVNEEATFNQRLQREMLNNIQPSSGASREESWISEQQVDPKLADNAFRAEMANRVIMTPTSQPAPWDAGETPAAVPSPWDQNNNKLFPIQQRSHIPTHPHDGGRQLANAVGAQSEPKAEQDMSNGLEDVNMVRDPLPASGISSDISMMRNAGTTRANAATSSSENQQPSLKSKARELLRALIHGREQQQQQHATQAKEVHDRLRLAPRSHEKYHKEAHHQQGSSESSIEVRQDKAMTSLPQEHAMNQNLEKQEVSSSLNPRTQQVREGLLQMQEAQSQLTECLRAAMGDINK